MMLSVVQTCPREGGRRRPSCVPDEDCTASAPEAVVRPVEEERPPYRRSSLIDAAYCTAKNGGRCMSGAVLSTATCAQQSAAHIPSPQSPQLVAKMKPINLATPPASPTPLLEEEEEPRHWKNVLCNVMLPERPHPCPTPCGEESPAVDSLLQYLRRGSSHVNQVLSQITIPDEVIEASVAELANHINLSSKGGFPENVGRDYRIPTQTPISRGRGSTTNSPHPPTAPSRLVNLLEFTYLLIEVGAPRVAVVASFIYIDRIRTLGRIISDKSVFRLIVAGVLLYVRAAGQELLEYPLDDSEDDKLLSWEEQVQQLWQQMNQLRVQWEEEIKEKTKEEERAKEEEARSSSEPISSLSSVAAAAASSAISAASVAAEVVSASLRDLPEAMMELTGVGRDDDVQENAPTEDDDNIFSDQPEDMLIRLKAMYHQQMSHLEEQDLAEDHKHLLSHQLKQLLGELQHLEQQKGLTDTLCTLVSLTPHNASTLVDRLVYMMDCMYQIIPPDIQHFAAALNGGIELTHEISQRITQDRAAITAGQTGLMGQPDGEDVVSKWIDSTFVTCQTSLHLPPSDTRIPQIPVMERTEVLRGKLGGSASRAAVIIVRRAFEAVD